MLKSIALLLGLAVAGATSLPGAAQTSAAMPSCAAGDAVVWENTSTKAYHLAGDSYFGKTKHGAYACKSAADSAGFHLAGSKHSGHRPAGATPSAMLSPQPMAPQSMATASPGLYHHGKHHHRSGAAPSPAPSPEAT